MPPVLIAAGVGAAATIGGAAISSHASSSAATKAAAAQTANTNSNNALALDIYNRNTANFQPDMATGGAATASINSLLAGDSHAFDDFRNSTNYNFTYGQGMNALNQGLAGQSALHSGAAQKSAIRYGQGQAGNSLGGYISLLQGQQNLGFGAAQALAGVGNTYGASVTANNNNAADAASNAALLRGQAQSQMIGTTANALGNFASSFGGGFKPSSSAYPTYGGSGNAPYFVGGGFGR